MKRAKIVLGLWREDLKSKLWMIVAVWYLMGMLCLLFSAKMTIPEGEVRSLYVGPGNTSFFAVMILLGILMGIGAFPYLQTQQKADLYLSLPFSRSQLFAVGYMNNFLIFSIPAVVCRLLFFRISLSMGYCKYGDSVRSVWAGCLTLVLGFLFVMSLSMLAALWARGGAYVAGLTALLFLGSGAGLALMEKMLAMFGPSFYRSAALEQLKGYLSFVSLLKNAAGIEEYADSSGWVMAAHLPYLLYLAAAVVFLFLLNLFFFRIRPAEPKRGAFTFPVAEWFVRYSCVVLGGLWFIDLLQVFSFGVFSWAPVIAGVVISVPLIHGLVNILLARDAKRFLSGKWHLLIEVLLMAVLTGGFSLWGKWERRIPVKEDVALMAIALPALQSGDDSGQVLQNMQLTGEPMEAAYDWVNKDYGEESAGYEFLVKYEGTDGRQIYSKYHLPWYALDGFEEIFAGEGFKEGTYQALRLNSMKYYEICWTNGIESYTLDLAEQERQELWEAYREDAKGLAFSDIRQQTPIGRITFASTKNQGDVTADIYPGYERTCTLLYEYGIAAQKEIKDYDIIKIVADKYLLTEGLLYQVNSLEWEKTITDASAIETLSEVLYCEEFCEDYQLNEKNLQMEFTVYYRDSDGRTIDAVKCRAQADPVGNEVLKELLR